MEKSSNSGFSLVELLIAIAISAIVVSMVSFILIRTTKEYSDTSSEVELMNESSTVLNQITKVLMEAKEIHIYDGGKKLITGSLDEDGKMVVTLGNERIIQVEDNNLYIFDKDTVANKSGYLMTKYLDSIEIEIDDECYISSQYVNPIVLNITLNFKNDKYSKSVSASVTLRNRITVLSVDGNNYTVSQ